LALAYKPNVKLRLGFVNQQGQQKGVDSLVVTDLINLARNRAMSDALLLTGDEDIRVGVQQAQEYGVRVHLLGIAPSRENQSGFLVQEADGVREISLDDMKVVLSRTTSITPPTRPVPIPVSPHTVGGAGQPVVAQLTAVAIAVAAELTAEEIEAVLRDSVGGSVPFQLDRRILVAGSQALGGSLEPAEKRTLRSAFLDACNARKA